MPRYIALLRGVGPAKPVPVDRLRRTVERLGYEDVVPVMHTGNAVFTGPRAAEPKHVVRIETALRDEFGFELPVVLRTRDQMADAIRKNPLPGAEAEPSRFLLFLLSAPPHPARLARLDPVACLPDEFRVVGREIYARFPNGVGRSKLGAKLLAGDLGVTMTSRNWNTVRKLLDVADRR